MCEETEELKYKNNLITTLTKNNVAQYVSVFLICFDKLKINMIVVEKNNRYIVFILNDYNIVFNKIENNLCI